MKRVQFSVIAWTLLMSLQPAVAALKVGDPAPALSVKHWIKGEPVDLSKARPGGVYVVEFWATWCNPCVMSIPHMSELQDHFKSRDVTFIGVSDENKTTVEKFLKRGFDSKMRYTVAIDDDRKTNQAWMQAAEKKGIPCAFIVKDGKVQWIGHPMEGLDLKVAELCGDKAYAEHKAKLHAIAQKIMESAESQKWDGVRDGLGEYLKLEPGSIQHQLALYHVLLVKLKKPDDAKKHGATFIEGTTDIDGLNSLAWVIAKHEDFEGARDMELASRAAQKAMTLSKEESVEVLDTYAMVLAESGKMDEAVKMQERAVAKCDPEDARSKRELTNRLEEYKKKQKGA